MNFTGSDFKTRADKMDNFLKQYPNSIYLDQVLRLSTVPYFKYYIKSLDEQILFLEDIINAHPNFASNYERLTSIILYYERKNDLEGYNQFIDELKSEHKDNYILNKVLYYTNRDFEARHGNK